MNICARICHAPAVTLYILACMYHAQKWIFHTKVMYYMTQYTKCASLKRHPRTCMYFLQIYKTLELKHTGPLDIFEILTYTVFYKRLSRFYDCMEVLKLWTLQWTDNLENIAGMLPFSFCSAADYIIHCCHNILYDTSAKKLKYDHRYNFQLHYKCTFTILRSWGVEGVGRGQCLIAD